MSLYREPRRRAATATVVAAAAALLVGALAGFLVGRATKGEPSLASQLGDVRAEAERSVQALELVRLHYRAGLREEAQFRGALDQVRRARESYVRIEPDLHTLDRRRADAAGAALDETVALVERKGPAAAVERAAARAEDSLRAAAGLP